MKELNNKTVRFTVETVNNRKGTVTFPDYLSEYNLVGSYEKNIQAVDEVGNNIGFDGTIKKILKIEEFYFGEWKLLSSAI